MIIMKLINLSSDVEWPRNLEQIDVIDQIKLLLHTASYLNSVSSFYE